MALSRQGKTAGSIGSRLDCLIFHGKEEVVRLVCFETSFVELAPSYWPERHQQPSLNCLAERKRVDLRHLSNPDYSQS